MDQALQNVNDVVFAQSYHESTTAYNKWSEVYDEDIESLGCTFSLEAAKMFKEHGMNQKLLLDIGGGKNRQKTDRSSKTPSLF